MRKPDLTNPLLATRTVSLLFLFYLMFTASVNAQTGFEGYIRYKASPPESPILHEKEDDPVEIKIFFTVGKLLIRTNKNGEENEEHILVLIDSAKVYRIDRREKNYRVKKLSGNQQLLKAEKEIIAGYTATPFQINNGNMSQLAGANATLWYADNLFFYVPEKYEGNEEMMMVKNNRILLKALIKMDDYSSRYETDGEETERTGEENVVTLTAIEVVPGKIDPSLFMIPSAFTRAISAEPFMTDTAMIYMDTVARLMTDTVAAKAEALKAPEAPAKKPAKKPVKSTSSTNGEMQKEE